MKKVKTICSILCAAVLFIGFGKILHYILVDDTSSYTRLTMHELYHAESNIDVLFVGSSHVYQSLNPEITDKIFQRNTFNAGSSSQGMDGSLAMIKETLAYHNVKEIYLEIFFKIATAESNKERTQLTQTYIISDYMKPSVRKLQYLLQASSKDYYITGLIPFRRNWEKCFDLNFIYSLIKKKQTDDYINYRWTKNKDDKTYYVTKGFVANDAVITEEEINTTKNKTEIIEMASISDDWKNALQDIITLCKKEKIKLTLFTAPMPEFYLATQKNYSTFSEFINDIANRSELPYYDFNLCKPEYFSTQDHSLFYDYQHLNTKGAAEFSIIFSKFFTNKLSKQDLFYDRTEKKSF